MKTNICKLLKLFTVLLLMSSSAIAQRSPMRYKRIDSDHLNLTRYEADTSAKALVLGDYGVVEIKHDNHFGWHYQFERHLRVKIFDRDAYDIANFKIPLYNQNGERERLTTLKAVVYTKENGKTKKTRFKRKNSYEEAVSSNRSTINFTLPNIREGSVFDLKYTVTSPFLFNLPIWYFQSDYPSLFSELRLFLPEYFTYKPMMQGYLVLDSQESSSSQKKLTIEWEESLPLGETKKHSTSFDYIENKSLIRIDSIPALTREPHMNNPINFISKIEYELMSIRLPYGKYQDFSSSWDKLNMQLLNHNSFGKELTRAKFLENEVELISENNSLPEDKLMAAFQLIQREMTWDGVNSIYASKKLRKIWDEKQGNVADINLLLVLLLRELGVKSHPVIISTRKHGIVNPSQIMLNSFNYVVALATVNGEEFIVDATDKDNPYYLLPQRCLNGDGRLVSRTNGRWVNLNAHKNYLEKTETALNVKPCGSKLVNISRKQQNYAKIKTIKNYKKFNTQDDFIDDFESKHSGIEIRDFAILNKEDWSEPLITNYEFEVLAPDTISKKVIYLNPMSIDRISSNPFKLEKRLFPVDFIYPFNKKYDISVVIPDGYEVQELPQDFTFSMPNETGSYSCSYSIKNTNTIDVNVEMRINKTIFAVDEYPNLRAFYAKVVEEQAKNIVIKQMQNDENF